MWVLLSRLLNRLFSIVHLILRFKFQWIIWNSCVFHTLAPISFSLNMLCFKTEVKRKALRFRMDLSCKMIGYSRSSISFEIVYNLLVGLDWFLAKCNNSELEVNLHLSNLWSLFCLSLLSWWWINFLNLKELGQFRLIFKNLLRFYRNYRFGGFGLGNGHLRRRTFGTVTRLKVGALFMC